jgi:hypothetical protein
MKVRLLWAAPGSPLKCGEVYDLADGAQLIAGGDAEKAAKGVPALTDPRPQPEAVPESHGVDAAAFAAAAAAAASDAAAAASDAASDADDADATDTDDADDADDAPDADDADGAPEAA